MSIYPLGLDKRIFPGYRPPWGKVGNNSHYVPYLNFNFGLCYPGSGLRLATWRPLVVYPRFLDKTNFPRILTSRAQYLEDPSTIPSRSSPLILRGSPVAYRCLGHPAQVSCAYFPLGLNKTISSRVLPPLGQRRQQYQQLALSSVPALASGWATRR